MYDIIRSNPIFDGTSEEQFKKIFRKIHYRTIKYSKGETVFTESDFKSSMGIILSGMVEAQKLHYSGKIIILNRMTIEGFTYESIHERVLCFLESEKERQDNQNEIIIKYSKQELAEYLCISRASLYRALNDLSKEGLIKWKKNKVVLKILYEIKKHFFLVIIVNYRRFSLGSRFGIYYYENETLKNIITIYNF